MCGRALQCRRLAWPGSRRPRIRPGFRPRVRLRSIETLLSLDHLAVPGWDRCLISLPCASRWERPNGCFDAGPLGSQTLKPCVAVAFWWRSRARVRPGPVMLDANGWVPGAGGPTQAMQMAFKPFGELPAEEWQGAGQAQMCTPNPSPEPACQAPAFPGRQPESLFCTPSKLSDHSHDTGMGLHTASWPLLLLSLAPDICTPQPMAGPAALAPVTETMATPCSGHERTGRWTPC